MSRRLLDDPWRVFQLYALLLALVVVVLATLHLATTADQWTDDGRPVQHHECINCGVWQR